MPALARRAPPARAQARNESAQAKRGPTARPPPPKDRFATSAKPRMMLTGSTNNQACRAPTRSKTVARGRSADGRRRRSCRRCLARPPEAFALSGGPDCSMSARAVVRSPRMCSAQLGISFSWTSQLGAGLHMRTARSSDTARCRLRSSSAPPQLAGSSRRPSALANLEV
jgi:hypothetical protein